MHTEPASRPFVSRITLARVTIAAGLIALVWVLRDVVLLIFFAALLAAAARGAADWIAEHTGMRVGWALAAVIVLSVVALGAVAYWAGPRMADQIRELVNRLTSEYGGLLQRFEGSSVGGAVAKSGSATVPQDVAGRVAKPAVMVLGFSFEVAAGIVVLFVTSIYFAASPEVYVSGVVRLFPIPHRERIRQVMQELAHILRLWLLGQLVDMVVVGVLAAVGLWLVGVPVPFALGILSGLFTFVPYLGTLVSGVIAIAIGLSVSFSTALWALGVFTLCHIVEGYVVAPLVQKRMVELPPALTVLSMTVLGALFGTMGVILGTPVAAAGLVAVRMLYIGDVLGDHESELPRERPAH